MPLRTHTHKSGLRPMGRFLMGTAALTAALFLLAPSAFAQTEPPASASPHYHAQTPAAAPAPAASAPAAPSAPAPAEVAPAPAVTPPAAPVTNAAQANTAPVNTAPAQPEAPSAVAPAPVSAQAPQGTPAPAPVAGDATPAAPQDVPAVPVAEAEPEEFDTQPSTLPHDLSPWGMFMAADWVVKAVMIGLAFASVVTWTVWFGKSLQLAFARRTVRRTLDVLRAAPTLADAANRMPKGKGPAQATVVAALDEWKSSANLPSEGVKERVAVALNRIEAAAGRRMIAGTGLLATIGATAPFVGLFGTVWGIMNSFIGISKAQTTNLAIVAPGIAEALLATAIGLVAAIPAVVIYNMFARSIAGYKSNISDCSAEVMRHLSRDLDRETQAEKPRSLRAAAE